MIQPVGFEVGALVAPATRTVEVVGLITINAEVTQNKLSEILIQVSEKKKTGRFPAPALHKRSNVGIWQSGT